MLILIEFGDITIGDFWGLGESIPFNHNKSGGTSLVLINNARGKKYFEEIKDKIFFEKRSVEEAVSGNDQLRHPSHKNENHNKFIELYLKHGAYYALNKLG